MANIKHIHVMKIMEYAAAIALVLRPDQAIRYFKTLGVEVGDMNTAASAVESTEDFASSVHNPAVAAALMRDLGSIKR